MAAIRKAFNSDLFYSTEPLQLVSIKPEIHSVEFQKSHQFFIGVHNKALTVASMRVSNPDPAPAIIHG